MHAADRRLEEDGWTLPDSPSLRATPDPAFEPTSAAPAAEPTSSSPVTPSRRHTFAVVAPLMVLLALWLWLFAAEGAFKGGPAGKAFGADYAMFAGAAQVLKSGGNPFDHALLYRTESTMLHREGLPILANKAIVRVGNPPLLFWALQPLTRLPFQTAALVWMLALYLLSGLGFLASLRYFGWSRRFLPVLVFLFMPPVVTSAFYGNVSSLVFAGLGFSLALLRRFPVAAGALLACAWLKPQVALPAAVLIVLFHPTYRNRLLDGFGVATICLTALTVVTTGWQSLVHWAQALTGYSKDIAQSPSIASLSGLYVRWAPASMRFGLEVAVLGAALALTALWWWRHREAAETPLLAYASLWFVWFLATPYAHFYDEMLLAFPMLAFLGKNACRITQRLPASALYLMFFSLLLISWAPVGVQLLCVPLLVVTVCLDLASRRPHLQTA